jgi:hypothetical protein
MSSLSKSLYVKHPHPAIKVAKKELWIAGQREVPKHACDTGNFDEKLHEFHSDHFLVLCSDGKDVRIMRVFDTVSEGAGCGLM